MIDNRRRRATAGDRGVGALECLGALAVAAVLIIGVALAGLGSQARAIAAESICSITRQADCAGQPPQTPYQRALSGQYVALGDSYASGDDGGDGAEDTGTDDRDDLWPFDDAEEDQSRCRPSRNSYSRILSADNDFAGGSRFVACSGEQAQLAALTGRTTLVTLTSDGGDLGFADVIEDCIVSGGSGFRLTDSCQLTHDRRIAERLPQLRRDLVDLSRQARENAPSARIIVVGYPALFAADQGWLNQRARDLNATLAAAAAEADVEFVDPTDSFRGHGLGSDDPWLNDLAWIGPGVMTVEPRTFQPNAKGHQALAELIQQQLEHPDL